MTHIQRLLENISSDRIYIQTHDYPDADAISCAYGLRVLLLKYGIRASICFRQWQDSYSTLKLVEQLHVNLQEMADEVGTTRLPDDAEIILVDTQLGNTNTSDIGGTIVACIDHHPITSANYKYYDIRPEMGACATIICEYFLEEGIPFHKKTATLLTYGIRTDTANLCRGVSGMDVQMLASLYDMADYDLIRYLENSMLYARDLGKYADSIRDTKIYHNISFTDAGEDCTDIFISHVCDFMLSLVEVELAITCTSREKGIKISIRCVSPNIDAGELIHVALNGIGSGGGHPTMAGGFVPYRENMDVKALIDNINTRFIEAAHRLGCLSRHICDFKEDKET